MAEDRHRRIRRLFEMALEMPAASRGAFLEESCGSDAELRREVEALLAADADSQAEDLRPTSVEPEGATDGPEAPQADRIGPYRLTRKIGEGGMGIVWEAEQEYPIRRTVAIKLVKHGLSSASVLSRFETERQALALMDHPNVARGQYNEAIPMLIRAIVTERSTLAPSDDERARALNNLGNAYRGLKDYEKALPFL